MIYVLHTNMYNNHLILSCLLYTSRPLVTENATRYSPLQPATYFQPCVNHMRQLSNIINLMKVYRGCCVTQINDFANTINQLTLSLRPSLLRSHTSLVNFLMTFVTSVITAYTHALYRIHLSHSCS